MSSYSGKVKALRHGLILSRGASLKIRNAGLFALLSGTILVTPAVANETLDAMSVGMARELAVESGGKVVEVEDLDDGTYEMKIHYPDEAPVYLRGYECRGVGDAKRCEDFKLSAWFGLDSEAEALAMEHTVDIVWLSDMQDGDELRIWRYEFVSGATRERLLKTFRTFVDTMWAAYDIIYPKSPDAGAQKAG